jgi:dihydroflavonol-4-reductase
MYPGDRQAARRAGRQNNRHRPLFLIAIYRRERLQKGQRTLPAAEDPTHADDVRVLVTGGTGKVGNAVVHALVASGHEVIAPLRDLRRADGIMPANVEAIHGDVTDPGSLDQAMKSVEVVFNAMGLPEQWLADESLFERVNVTGSMNVVKAAVRAGARRVVHTSTIDVFRAARGCRFDESMLADFTKATPYERSKQRAEHAVLEVAGGDIEVVFVNPALVYGSGPSRSTSLEHRMFPPLVRGLLPIVPPGGFGMVFTESLADAQLKAADKGESGERYIVCDGHTTLANLAEMVVGIAGRGHVPLTLPRAAAAALAATGEAVARWTGHPPALSRGQLAFLLWDAVPDSTKAQRDLAWSPPELPGSGFEGR